MFMKMNCLKENVLQLKVLVIQTFEDNFIDKKGYNVYMFCNVFYISISAIFTLFVYFQSFVQSHNW